MKIKPGNYYYNPQCGPVWMCIQAGKLVAQTTVTGYCLRVTVDDELNPQFLQSLEHCTVQQTEQRTTVQASAARYYKASSVKRYAYQ